ncbi:ShlB/FhaC/HecB family hemolysin secretion/activation protein [Azoarcus sp. TTM-91]|uniref:ShlB/FhaC/HecB family hemolysin secretion/activation protein n=1 Tax=Azoarcus sp. TTM-91 TaxID=2691581 RepID=UPI001B7D007D|nr:ShlB/FhaC/HecB family hemolysin secretion/activation protein [Azoarcus sp. TTM-91]
MTAMRSIPLLLGLACGGLAMPAAAQIAPGAGQSLREVAPPAPLPAERKLDLQLPEDGAAAAQPLQGGPTVMVRGFTVSGNQAIDSAELLALLADLQGRELDLGELENAAARLSRRYRELGYPLARAYVPEQRIKDGMVALVVLEGRYGAVQVNNESPLGAFALAPLRELHVGEAVRAAALERALLLLNERAGAKARGVLRPGSEVGATDLLVGLDATPAISGSLGYDNAGNRYTGASRLSAGLGINSPTGLGDRLDLRVLGTEEKQAYYYAGYQLPLGAWGTSAGISYSYLEYELGKDFKALDAHGTARAAGVFLNQPLVVSRELWVNARLQYDHKRLSDKIDLYGTDSGKRSRVTTLTVDGNARDALFGGGLSQFSLSWSLGQLSLRSAEDRENDDASARTRGGFNVWRTTLTRLQRLDDRFSLFGRLRGQWADGNLDGSEKFGLGGPYGVRAYPQGEAQGDEGWIANLELRYALMPEWQLSAFLDHGQIRRNRQPWDDADNHRELGAMGVGTAWSSEHWRLEAYSAWRVGDARPESDKHKEPRFWLQAAWLF